MTIKYSHSVRTDKKTGKKIVTVRQTTRKLTVAEKLAVALTKNKGYPKSKKAK
jgi:hypothetical protein